MCPAGRHVFMEQPPDPDLFKIDQDQNLDRFSISIIISICELLYVGHIFVQDLHYGSKSLFGSVAISGRSVSHQSCMSFPCHILSHLESRRCAGSITLRYPLLLSALQFRKREAQ